MPNWIPFSPGIGDWWRRSSMAPAVVLIPAAHGFRRKWRRWWSVGTENRGWGYDSILGALANLGYQVSDQTVGNILRRHNIAPAPERSRTTTWKEFIKSHIDVLVGADFFTVEVLTWGGLVTYYVLFFIEVGSRRVSLGGITRHPDSCWMEQVARNATMQDTGYLNGCRYLLQDRDRKFCREFRETLAAGGVECTPIPARSPDLKGYASHCTSWVPAATTPFTRHR